MDEHKRKIADGFTKKYNISTLVYYESTENVESAITKEKSLKKYSRSDKLALIENENPDWKDLSLEF